MRSSLEQRMSVSINRSMQASAYNAGSNKQNITSGLERLGLRNSMAVQTAIGESADPQEWSHRRHHMMDTVQLAAPNS